LVNGLAALGRQTANIASRNAFAGTDHCGIIQRGWIQHGRWPRFSRRAVGQIMLADVVAKMHGYGQGRPPPLPPRDRRALAPRHTARQIDPRVLAGQTFIMPWVPKPLFPIPGVFQPQGGGDLNIRYFILKNWRWFRRPPGQGSRREGHILRRQFMRRAIAAIANRAIPIDQPNQGINLPPVIQHDDLFNTNLRGRFPGGPAGRPGADNGECNSFTWPNILTR
jgi:hypothetical protein